jgi:hypothetical protein
MGGETRCFIASGENVGEKHPTGLEIKLLVRMLNRRVIGFLIVLVNELVNGHFSWVVSRIPPCYLCGYVKDDEIRNGAEHSEKIGLNCFSVFYRNLDSLPDTRTF